MNPLLAFPVKKVPVESGIEREACLRHHTLFALREAESTACPEATHTTA